MLNLLNQTYCRVWDSEILCFNLLFPTDVQLEVDKIRLANC